MKTRSSSAFKCTTVIGLALLALVMGVPYSACAERDVRIGFDDDSMIRYFRENKKQIEQLTTQFLAEPKLRSVSRYTAFTKPQEVARTNPELVLKYRKEAQKIGFSHGLERDEESNEMRLRASISGFIDSSTEKGFAYRSTPPSEVSHDLDMISNPTDGVTYYRHIDGPWYIYSKYVK